MNIKAVYNRKNRTRDDGTALVHVYVYIAGKKTYIDTGVRITPRQWKKGRVVHHRNAHDYNEHIATLITRATSYYHEHARQGRSVTPQDVAAHLKSKPGSVPLHEHITRNVPPGRARSTQKKYDNLAKHVRTFDASTPIEQADDKWHERFTAHLFKQGLAASTIRTLTAYLATFTSKRVAVRVPSRDLVYLTSQEVDAFAAHDTRTRHGHVAQSQRLFVLGCYTGLRFSDLMSLTPEHFYTTRDGMYLRVYQGKTQRPLVLPLSLLFSGRAELVARVVLERMPIHKQYASEFGKHVKSIARAAGMRKHISPHTSRHTFAMRLLNEERVPIHVVSRLLGHASVTTTERHYARLLEGTVEEFLRR
mgnify:CR=1 FL=1